MNLFWVEYSNLTTECFFCVAWLGFPRENTFSIKFILCKRHLIIEFLFLKPLFDTFHHYINYIFMNLTVINKKLRWLIMYGQFVKQDLYQRIGICPLSWYGYVKLTKPFSDLPKIYNILFNYMINLKSTTTPISRDVRNVIINELKLYIMFHLKVSPTIYWYF